MAAPTYFHSASNPADSATATNAEPNTFAVTPPGSMVSGDLVLLIGAHRGTGDTITLSEQSGQAWSDTSNLAGTGTSFHLWWCQFNGSWGADPSLAFAAEGGTIPTSVVMHVFRPAAAGTWTADTAIAGGAMTSATPQTITGITPNNNDNVTLAGWLQSNIATWGTLSGVGWVAMEVAQWRNSSGSDISMTFAHQLQGTKAATNNVSQTPNTATTGTKFTIAWYVNSSVSVNVNAVGADLTLAAGTVTETATANASAVGVTVLVEQGVATVSTGIVWTYPWGGRDYSSVNMNVEFPAEGASMAAADFYVGGWAYDNAGFLTSAIEILVDGVFAGLGNFYDPLLDRADVATVWENAPTACGFYSDYLPATPTGARVINVRITDINGKVAISRDLNVTIT